MLGLKATPHISSNTFSWPNFCLHFSALGLFSDSIHTLVLHLLSNIRFYQLDCFFRRQDLLFIGLSFQCEENYIMNVSFLSQSILPAPIFWGWQNGQFRNRQRANFLITKTSHTQQSSIWAKMPRQHILDDILDWIRIPLVSKALWTLCYSITNWYGKTWFSGFPSQRRKVSLELDFQILKRVK